MALPDLFNKTFTVKKNAGSDKYGRDLPKTNGDTGDCRLAPAQGEFGRDPDGEDVVLDAIIYLNATVDVDEQDDIDVAGTVYRILEKRVQSRAKDDHHIRLGVRRV